MTTIPCSLMLGGMLLAGIMPGSEFSTTLTTPDGHPSLEGFWNGSSRTPWQRPAEFAGKPFVSIEELSRYLNSKPAVVEEGNFHDPPGPAVIIEGQIRSSMVVDPPDGRIPPFTASMRQAMNPGRERLRDSSGYWDLSLAERCLPIVQVPMIPPSFNAGLGIIQTRGAVMILTEMDHDVRTIFLDGRPHLPAHIRQWQGDSIGRWEGDALVVDTTNFRPERPGWSSLALHVTETFRRLDEGTILYRARVDDPGAYASPWTVEFLLHAMDGPIIESACHEGNRDVPMLIRSYDRTLTGRLRNGTRRFAYSVVPHQLRYGNPNKVVAIFLGGVAACLTLAILFWRKLRGRSST